MNETELRTQAEQAARDLLKGAKLHKGQIVVIGCSTSEICSGCACFSICIRRQSCS